MKQPRENSCIRNSFPACTTEWILIVCLDSWQNKQLYISTHTWEALNYAIKTLCMLTPSSCIHSTCCFKLSPCHVFLHPTLIDIAFRKVAQFDFSSKWQKVEWGLIVLEGKQATYLAFSMQRIRFSSGVVFEWYFDFFQYKAVCVLMMACIIATIFKWQLHKETHVQGACTCCISKASYLIAFCPWDSRPHLPVTQMQGWNAVGGLIHITSRLQEMWLMDCSF